MAKVSEQDFASVEALVPVEISRDICNWTAIATVVKRLNILKSSNDSVNVKMRTRFFADLNACHTMDWIEMFLEDEFSPTFSAHASELDWNNKETVIVKIKGWKPTTNIVMK